MSVSYMRNAMVAEGVGTSLLLYVIVGSGIAAEQLGIDPAVQLLSHAVVVGLGLAALIAVFQTVSGSHFNPAVTIAFWRTTCLGGREGFGFIGAQLVGAVAWPLPTSPSGLTWSMSLLPAELASG